MRLRERSEKSGSCADGPVERRTDIYHQEDTEFNFPGEGRRRISPGDEAPCLRFFEIAGYLSRSLSEKGKKQSNSLIIIGGWGGGNDEVVKYKKTQATRTENNTQTRSEIQPHTAQI